MTHVTLLDVHAIEAGGATPGCDLSRDVASVRAPYPVLLDGNQVKGAPGPYCGVVTEPGPGRRCDACGTTAAAGDRRCGTCGHDLDAPALLLPEGDRIAPPGPTAESDRRTRAATITAIVLVVAGALAWLVATSGSDGSEDAAPDPTPTATPAPAPSAAPTAVDIEPGPVAAAPVLGEPSGLLVAARGETGVLLIDLDDGERWVIEADPATTAGRSMAVLDGELWLVAGDQVVAYDLAARGRATLPVRTVAQDGVELLPLPVPTRTGALIATEASEWRVVQTNGDGFVAVESPVELLGAVPEGLLLSPALAGGVYLLEDDQLALGTASEPEVVTPGGAVAWSEAGVLAVECDRSMQCRTVLVDLRTGDRSVVPAELPTATSASISELSPDGRWYLSADPSEMTERVVDLADGGTIEGLVVGSLGAVAFTPDSNWAFLGGDPAERATLAVLPMDRSAPIATVSDTRAVGRVSEILVFERPSR